MKPRKLTLTEALRLCAEDLVGTDEYTPSGVAKRFAENFPELDQEYMRQASLRDYANLTRQTIFKARSIIANWNQLELPLENQLGGLDIPDNLCLGGNQWVPRRHARLNHINANRSLLRINAARVLRRIEEMDAYHDLVYPLARIGDRTMGEVEDEMRHTAEVS